MSMTSLGLLNGGRADRPMNSVNSESTGGHIVRVTSELSSLFNLSQ